MALSQKHLIRDTQCVERLDRILAQTVPDVECKDTHNLRTAMQLYFYRMCLAESGVLPQYAVRDAQSEQTLKAFLVEARVDVEASPKLAGTLAKKIETYARQVAEHNRAAATGRTSEQGYFTGWGEKVVAKKWPNMPDHLNPDKGAKR